MIRLGLIFKARLHAHEGCFRTPVECGTAVGIGSHGEILVRIVFGAACLLIDFVVPRAQNMPQLVRDGVNLRVIQSGVFHDRVIAAVRDLPKVCKHLHLPVQSGSSRVLAMMRRRHTREEYLDLVARIRAAIPNVQLSTDMIVGFPGETEADFEETLSLTEAVGYHSIYSFKYSERPNTLASRRMR